MPGIGRKSAERILAETGVEMEHFQNESRFSSWAGLVPECKESAGYQRIAARRGGKRALIAVAHTMLIAIYHILKEKVPYHDLGADYYSVINQEKIINRNIRTLEKLGVNVMIQPK